MDNKITNEVSITFLELTDDDNNVYNGDCSLVEFKNKVVLIDVGLDKSYNDICNLLKNKNIKTIDHIIISHFHSDHCGGEIDTDSSSIRKLCLNYNVKNIIIPQEPNWNKMIYDKNTGIRVDYSARYTNLQTFANKNGIKITIPNEDEIIDIDNGKFTFFNTSSEIYENYYNETFYNNENISYTRYNNFSLCTKLEVNDKIVYFTGDIEKKAQEILIDKFTPCDVLKIPHHLYNYQETVEFYKKITPLKCVAMTASLESTAQGFLLSNSYCNEIYRTSINGTVEIVLTVGGCVTNTSKNVNNKNFELINIKSLVGTDSTYTFEEMCKLIPVNCGIQMNVMPSFMYCPEPFKSMNYQEGYYIHIYRISERFWAGYASLKPLRNLPNGLQNLCSNRERCYHFIATIYNDIFSYEFREIQCKPILNEFTTPVDVGGSFTITEYYPGTINELTILIGKSANTEYSNNISNALRTNGGTAYISVSSLDGGSQASIIRPELKLVVDNTAHTLTITYVSCASIAMKTTGGISFSKITESGNNALLIRGYELN